ncbi:MAG: T9SS type A sorting domain-containing protein, partial [Candidatus Latescibacterota bacterium]
DISPANVGNGLIQIQDLALFSLTIGLTQGAGAWNSEGDIGPTDDWSRFGIPLPDDAVDFEDLMIFAMNYGNVAPPPLAGGAGVVATSERPLGELVSFKLVPVSADGDLVTYAVMIENDAKVLKGFSLDISYGLGNELVEVVASRSLSGKGSEHFFGTIERDLGKVELCVAALGIDAPFDHTGEVARVVVRESSVDPVGAKLEGADLRDVANRKDEIEITTPGAQTFVPRVSALMQNHPNPFNPTTRITYDVANAGHVRVEIYDVSGRMVRTLVNEHRGVGRYEVEWDGRNASGTPVHTGVYFYRMSAPGYTSQAKKMLLLK